MIGTIKKLSNFSQSFGIQSEGKIYKLHFQFVYWSQLDPNTIEEDYIGKKVEFELKPQFSFDGYDGVANCRTLKLVD